MQRVLDAFVRALGHVLLPRVIGLTLLPLLVMTALALGLGYFFWSGALEWMRVALASWPVVDWLDSRLQLGGLAGLLAPFALVALVTPVIVLTSLVVVSTFMTPVLARLVAARRFPALQRQQGASLAASIAWSAGSLLVAVVALILSLPLWLIPPLVLLLPPLIWGWLTYRVMSFDALADYASGAERAAIFKAHRWPLLAMGIVAGYMGAAPGIVWASGVLFAALFVVLVPLAIWIHTLVFVFSSLWFAHYCLDALQQLRAARSTHPTPPAPPPAGALPPADARSSITDVPWRDATHSS
ncbi:MAG: EI24 domain-containing protein [Pseudomonadota bacterium]|nr:EI24 domain-containing protein [Pseudomonadota bacterium]